MWYDLNSPSMYEYTQDTSLSNKKNKTWYEMKGMQRGKNKNIKIQANIFFLSFL